jgi:hypothetical protein
MRIPLSERSGLTLHPVAGQLGSLGEVDILSSSKIRLTRFTRHVSAVHDVPRFGLDPAYGAASAIDDVRSRERSGLSLLSKHSHFVPGSDIAKGRFPGRYCAA